MVASLGRSPGGSRDRLLYKLHCSKNAVPPRRAVKLGKWQLPLTPGIIPKRKPQLAHAIGQAVGGQLFTETDVKEALLSAEVRETVADSVLDGLAGSSRSLEELCQRGMGEAAYDRCKEAISQKLCEKLETEVRRMDLGSVIAAPGRCRNQGEGIRYDAGHVCP